MGGGLIFFGSIWRSPAESRRFKALDKVLELFPEKNQNIENMPGRTPLSGRRPRPAKRRSVAPRPRLPAIRELTGQTSTPLDTVIFLKNRGIFHDSKFCHRGHKMTLYCSPLRPPRYRCGICRKESSALVGTFFQGARVPLEKLITYMYFWSSDVSQARAREYSGISSHVTTARWRRRFRDVCAAHNSLQLPEAGTWQVDECQMGDRKVLGGVNESNGKVWFRIIPNRASVTVLPVMADFIDRDSIISTDGLSGYKPISRYRGLQWTHRVCVHSKGQYKDFITGACTNSIEATFRVLRYFYDGVDLQGHLAEQCFKKNTRPKDAFSAILDAIAALHPPR